jgi:aspartyl-tRNA(Asn)/glutamyl-tRNA(Gln) amidotransferase subunit B
MESSGRLTATQAKAVLAELVVSGGDPEDIATSKGFEALAGDVVAEAVDAAIAAAPEQWERYVGGEAKLAGFFVGKVMAATKGKADGKAVTALLAERAAFGQSGVG